MAKAARVARTAKVCVFDVPQWNLSNQECLGLTGFVLNTGVS